MLSEETVAEFENVMMSSDDKELHDYIVNYYLEHSKIKFEYKRERLKELSKNKIHSYTMEDIVANVLLGSDLKGRVKLI